MRLGEGSCRKVGVKAFAFGTLIIRFYVFLVAIAVGHLKVLCLRDHMKAFFACKIGKLPIFKSLLHWSLFFLLCNFEHLHRCSAHLKSVLYSILELGRNRYWYGHWLLACTKLLRAHWGLEKELVGRILCLFFYFCFLSAHSRGSRFLILRCGYHRLLLFYETWWLILFFMRLIEAIFWPRSGVVLNWRVSLWADSSLVSFKDQVGTKLLCSCSAIFHIKNAGILDNELLLQLMLELAWI